MPALKNQLTNNAFQTPFIDTQICLWSCRTGAELSGDTFMNTLAQTTNATVFATENLVGNNQLGGTWNLEKSAAPRKGVPFSAEALQGFEGVLPAPPTIMSSMGGDRINMMTYDPTSSPLPNVPLKGDNPNSFNYVGGSDNFINLFEKNYDNKGSTGIGVYFSGVVFNATSVKLNVGGITKVAIINGSKWGVTLTPADINLTFLTTVISSVSTTPINVFPILYGSAPSYALQAELTVPAYNSITVGYNIFKPY
jgi:hypothetical protein